MKGTEKYIPVVLFIVTCKMALTFESVNEIYNVVIKVKVV